MSKNNVNSIRSYVKPFVKILYTIVDVLFHWLFKIVYGGASKSMPPIKDLLLLESATSIAHKIRTKKITSVQVLESFIERIKEVNPVLNCVVADRFDEARKEAKAADDLIKSGLISEEKLAKDRPFLGVPFSTKDCIPIKGLIHSSGLVRRRRNVAEEDATVVSRLRAAGAIPVALTNVSELCMWWEGANNVHGRTGNPYDASRIVGGSSGGEGAAQAASATAFGVGSDIGGSIRMPAHFNGVFGHKPSPGAVPNHGQYPKPITKEQDGFLGLGPICRRAEDLAPLLQVLSGPNSSKLRLSEPVDITKLKYYYQESDGGSFLVSPVSSDIRALFGRVVQHLEKAYHIKAKKVHYQRFSKSASMWLANMKSPSGPSFQEQLANFNGTINPYIELVKWLFRMSEFTLIGLFTCLAEKGGCKFGDEKHKYLVEERGKFRLELLDLLADDGVLIYPTHPTSAPYHNEPLIKALNFSYTAVVNVLGLPATHVPMGLDRDGLPIGLQVIAADGNDRLCLAVAREFEKAFGGWVPPVIQA